MKNTEKEIRYNIKEHSNSNIPLGSVIAFIGPRKSGKSVAMRHLCYDLRHVHHFIVISKSEKYNQYYTEFVPKKCIYDEWKPDLLKNIFKVQETLIKKYGSSDPRCQLVLIIDDYLCDKKMWKTPEIIELFQNGRHLQITFIFAMQYSIGIPTDVRGQISFVFVFAQETINEQKKIYENWVGTFPTFKIFQSVFNAITVNYRCLVANRDDKSSKDVEKKIFTFKANPSIKTFKVGNIFFWKEDNERIVEKDNLIIKFEK